MGGGRDEAVFVNCGNGGVVLGQEGEEERSGAGWKDIEVVEGEGSEESKEEWGKEESWWEDGKEE